MLSADAKDTVDVQICSIGVRPDGLADLKVAYHGPGLGNPSGGCTNASDADLVLKQINGAWKLYDIVRPAGETDGTRDKLTRTNAYMRLVENETDADRIGPIY